MEEWRKWVRLRWMGMVRFLSGHKSRGYHANAGVYSRAVLTSTLFYRNMPQLEVFFERIFPRLRLQKGGQPLRVASMACSTGCEPYTIAIEALRRGVRDKLEIHGYDVDPGCIDTARLGLYSSDHFQDSLAGGLRVPAGVIERYFVRIQKDGRDLFNVEEAIRSSVQFHTFDVLRPDWTLVPSPGFDVVFFQNVLLHFSDESADRALTNVLRMMAPPAVLAIGGASLDWIERACPRVGLVPVPDQAAAIHDGWIGRRKLFEIGDRSYLALEPYGSKRGADPLRYCSLFEYGPSGQGNS